MKSKNLTKHIKQRILVWLLTLVYSTWPFFLAGRVHTNTLEQIIRSLNTYPIICSRPELGLAIAALLITVGTADRWRFPQEMCLFLLLKNGSQPLTNMFSNNLTPKPNESFQMYFVVWLFTTNVIPMTSEFRNILQPHCWNFRLLSYWFKVN